MTQKMIYIIPVIALIAALWSCRNMIIKLFKKGEITLAIKNIKTYYLYNIKKKKNIVNTITILSHNECVKKRLNEKYENEGKRIDQKQLLEKTDYVLNYFL